MLSLILCFGSMKLPGPWLWPVQVLVVLRKRDLNTCFMFFPSAKKICRADIVFRVRGCWREVEIEDNAGKVLKGRMLR